MKKKHPYHYMAQAIPLKGLYYVFKALPLDIASNLGGGLARRLGMLLGVNKVARRNLSYAFPEMEKDQMDIILKGMWDNLGRIVAELPHVAEISGNVFHELVEIEGLEHIREAAVRKRGTIFVTGHLGNWEIVPKTMHEGGIVTPLLIYRKANNPYIDKIIIDTRRTYPAESIPKGSVGARQLIKAIQAGRSICILVDQKQNDGIAVPFFGRDAMTAPAIATLALKYDCALVPIQVIRKKGATFRVKVHPELDLEKTGDAQKDTLNIMARINAILEGFIKQNPEQWFWVHNRWPKA